MLHKELQHGACLRHSVHAAYHHGEHGAAQLHAEVVQAVLRFLQFGGGGVVCHGGLLHHAVTGCEGSGGLLLCASQLVGAGCQRGERLCYASAAHAEFLQHGGDAVHTALAIEGFQKGKQGLVGVLLQKRGELLHVKACTFGHFGGVGKEGVDDVLHGRRTLLHVHLILVHYRCNAQ